MNTLVGLLAFAICAAPIPKAVKPPEPTKEQLKHAEKKISELGGWCHFIPVSNDELAANHFVLQKQVTPEVLEKLDFLTFRCSLQLHDSCGITDDTLAEIVRRVPYIDRLELHSTHITSKGLQELPKLGRLQSLQIQCPKIDDDAMNSIAKLENLEFLWLEECPITDVGIKLIASNTRLTSLRLKGVDVTGGHLQVLKKLPLEWLVVENISYANDLLPILLEIKSLKSLVISGSSLDDEGARQLGKLKSLVLLNLDESSVTDEGVKYLVELEELTELSLFGMNVSDASATILAQMKKLASLNLNGTDFTDSGLGKLAESKSLQHISVGSTQVTNEAVAAFKKKKPDVSVER